ncbi:uncharacterized protein ISCGN_021502 [Ixodes scapularis]
MRVVVNHSESRRVVQVEEGWCETTLRESIAAKFPECDVSEVLIQVYDKEFETFLDLSPDTVLEDKSRIQLVTKPAATDMGRAVMAAEVISVVLPGPQEQSWPESVVSPHQYTLPELPKDIQLAVSQIKVGELIPYHVRQRILEWMFHDLCKHSIYPGKLYSEAARQLVWHHKQLKDQGSFGTGYPPDASAEDEHSLHGLLEWMNKELKRPLADMEKMQDAMQRTYASRRKFVCTEDPPASRIWELYPALLKKEQIFAEFLRITAVNAKHKFYEVVALHWLSVVTLTSSKPNRPEVLGVIMDELSKAEGEKQEGLQCLAFLVGVPQLLKENHCSFLRDDACDPVYPVAVTTNLATPTDGSSHVQLGNMKVDADSPAEAVLVAFCLYFVFNFKYEQRFCRTFTVIEHLLGLSHSHLGVMCTRLLSDLEKMKK